MVQLRDLSGGAARMMSRGLAAALDTIFPPQSLLTGAPLTARAVEGELWSHVQFLDDPCCAACGFPFDYDFGKWSLCGRCTARRPAYDRARSAMRYDDHSRQLVLNFKHGGRTAGLPIFDVHMRRAGRGLLDGADWLVPVPLHPKRLRKRRYNQSALLARRLSKSSGIAFAPDILRRVKNTDTQGGKSVSGRRRNVSGAFAVRGGYDEDVSGAHIVLVDDVFTTGATLEACARALKKGGARQVDALTLARVVKPQIVPK